MLPWSEIDECRLHLFALGSEDEIYYDKQLAKVSEVEVIKAMRGGFYDGYDVLAFLNAKSEMDCEEQESLEVGTHQQGRYEI